MGTEKATLIPLQVSGFRVLGCRVQGVGFEDFTVWAFVLIVNAFWMVSWCYRL